MTCPWKRSIWLKDCPVILKAKKNIAMTQRLNIKSYQFAAPIAMSLIFGPTGTTTNTSLSVQAQKVCNADFLINSTNLIEII
jgi:hypothetical protein